MPPPRTRKATQIADRRRTVIALYTRGMSMPDIAEQVHVDVATVSRDVAAVRAQWINETRETFTTAMNEQLARIDAIEIEAWAAWERSKGEKESTLTERHTGGEAQRSKAQVRHEERDGNPAFLTTISWCVSERSKLLGLYAPTKTEQKVENKTDLPPNVIRITKKVAHD